MTRVKICGLTRVEDVVLAVELGAEAVGFVLEPTSPRSISLEQAERLAGYAAPYCITVAVYGRTSEPFPRVQAIQAVEFRSRPSCTLVQAVRLREDTTFEEIQGLAEAADAIILDAFSSKGYGGTGEKINWSFAREIVDRLSKPVILAGGLNPVNVAEAILTVQPYAVDVSSGIESSPGVKDPLKMRAFFEAVNASASPDC